MSYIGKISPHFGGLNNIEISWKIFEALAAAYSPTFLWFVIVYDKVTGYQSHCVTDSM
jgi:hypothetical protein